MENFEDLTNTQLREQLKAHGLGNFPVTETTRKLLIKKLSAAVNGPAKPNKARRETINVNVSVKPTINDSEPDADTKKAAKTKTAANRRATIAISKQENVVINATNGTQVEPLVKPVLAPPKSPSRKSTIPVPVVSMVRIPEFADNSDDDLVAAAEWAEKQSKNRKKSRSPSLGKSTTVTTSYKHTIEPVRENVDDVIFINDSSDAEYNSEMLEKIRKTTPSRKTIQPTAPVSIIPVPSVKPVENREPTTNYSKLASEATNAYRRRYTTHTPTREKDAGAGGDNDDILKRVDTPFLSDFTRRLAELKAGPLPGLEQSFDYKAPSTNYRQEYRKTMYATTPSRSNERVSGRVLANKPPTAWNNFEQKIRWPLFILLALFVIVFVYVFFFSNY